MKYHATSKSFLGILFFLTVTVAAAGIVVISLQPHQFDTRATGPDTMYYNGKPISETVCRRMKLPCL
jgi:hypothetical protein